MGLCWTTTSTNPSHNHHEVAGSGSTLVPAHGPAWLHQHPTGPRQDRTANPGTIPPGRASSTWLTQLPPPKARWKPSCSSSSGPRGWGPARMRNEVFHFQEHGAPAKQPRSGGGVSGPTSTTGVCAEPPPGESPVPPLLPLGRSHGEAAPAHKGIPWM